MAKKKAYNFYDEHFSLYAYKSITINLMKSGLCIELPLDEAITTHGVTMKVRELHPDEINPRLGNRYELIISHEGTETKQHVFGMRTELERLINKEICRSKNLTDAETYDIVGRQGIEGILVDEYYVMSSPVTLHKFEDNSGYYLSAENWATESFQYPRIPKPKDVLELIGKYAFWKMRRRKVKK